MNKFLLAVIAILMIVCPSRAASPEPIFDLVLTLSQHTILPYEPLGATVTLKNISPQPQTLDAFPFDAGVKVRRDGEEEWKGYRWAMQRPGFMPAIPLPPKTFQPHEAVQKFVNIHIQLHEDEEYFAYSTFLLVHPFAEPGIYWVRARDWQFETKPQRLVVEEPRNHDHAAYLYLQEMPLYRAFALDQVLVEHDLLRQKQVDRGRRDVDKAKFTLEYPHKLREFIQRFPKSHYANWARLSLLFVKEAPLISLRYREPTAELFQEMRKVRLEMEQLAATLPPSVAAVAWFQAGFSAMLTDDIDAAETAFRHASETKDATIPGRIAVRRERMDLLPRISPQR